MIRFRDERAEDWLRNKSASLIDKLTGLWRGKVRNTIASGLEHGLNPRNVGLDLAGRIDPTTGRREGGLIDLNEDEKLSVAGFRRCLIEFDGDYFEHTLRDKRHDPAVRKSFREKTPLEPEKLERVVSRFSDRLLKNKADLLARTEMMAALNRSEYLSTNEALAKSDLPEGAVTRVWDSCGDDRVRPSHTALEGQRVVGFDECFVSPVTGARMLYPGDRSQGAPESEIAGCRCRVRYDIDFLFKYR